MPLCSIQLHLNLFTMSNILGKIVWDDCVLCTGYVWSCNKQLSHPSSKTRKTSCFLCVKCWCIICSHMTNNFENYIKVMYFISKPFSRMIVHFEAFPCTPTPSILFLNTLNDNYTLAQRRNMLLGNSIANYNYRYIWADSNVDLLKL